MGKPTTVRVSVAQNALFDRISNMDLWAPISKSNEYGARSKKNLKTGKLGKNSYIPNGLTKAQYQAIRDKEDKKKAANYQRNVKKAGVFENYTEFYLKRGTSMDFKWADGITNGHKMVKTKFDWSGRKDETKAFESSTAKSIFGSKKKANKKR